MANKRDLKKQIKYICGDLATECIMAAEYVAGVDGKVMRQIVVDIALLQENALQNTSFSFDKIPSDFANRKEYNAAREKYYRTAFKVFHEKFMTRIQDIVKSMNAALPDSVKENNKQQR